MPISAGFSARLVLSLAVFYLAGCASYTNLPAGTVKPVFTTAVIEQQSISLPDKELDGLQPVDYVVGPNDLLYVEYPGKPETQGAPSATAHLQPPAAAQSSVAALPSRGHRVDSLGYIKLPMMGRIKVAGLTTTQIRERIQEDLKKYNKEPDVDVEVAQPRSQPLYLIGQFRDPGVFYMDRPITLLQGMALGKGLEPSANLRSARIIRENKIVPVDINEMLFKANPRQNVWLKGGDTIYVPDNKAQNVFVFGAVKSPGPVPMSSIPMTLPQALSVSGFGELSYDPNIRIIRSLSTTRGELIVVDLNKIMSGEAMPLLLTEGDIVYVPRSRIGNWNMALNEILPTLQAFGALLQPFVQLKYLFDIQK